MPNNGIRAIKNEVFKLAETGLLNDTQKVEDTLKGKYLTFWTDRQLFGIPIADVVQIIGVQEITMVPEYPYYAKGIINLRGNVIPVIDIRLRFHKDELEYNAHTCIIVTNINEKAIGFIVDEVDEVADIDDKEISAPPHLAGDDSERYLTGIGTHDNHVVLLLDTAKVINQDMIGMLTSSI